MLNNAEKKYLSCQWCNNYAAFCSHLQNVKIEPENLNCRYGDRFTPIQAVPAAAVKKTLKRRGKFV